MISSDVESTIGDSSIIKVEDFNLIIYLKAEGSYTRIHFNDHSILVSKVLKYYESVLPPDIFLRIHNSYIVNVSYISYLRPINFVVLKTSTELPVSRRKRHQFLINVAKKRLIIKQKNTEY